ncbi:MAG: glycoside hydrolase family 5 protein [Oscillospiraceae bacterium]|nr:glycoside hydrolase family 5 protein [Oscillospiraceae bacterium]
MKKNIKKISAAVLAAAMLLTFSGCGDNSSTNDTPNNVDNETTTAAEAEPSASVVNDEIRDIPSIELVKEIKVGWSLGNTLDAYDSELGHQDVSSETCWGNPVTTKEMFTAVKDAGFNIVRIPVTWYNHMDENNNVDAEWMDRVQEVVDYAYSQDMFVILNIHHEDWHDPYYDTADASIEKLKALWTQIGNRFAGYDEHLIFEGLNEPRKRNTGMEWNGGDKEGHDVVNQMNAAFVETIRGLKGNNPKRHLMLPTYAASTTTGAINDYAMPEGDDKLIVSVHAYTPYGFALSDDLNDRNFTPDEGNANDIIYLMDLLKTSFIDKGIPVIIGEFGARSKGNVAERAEWAEYYISKASELGIPCLWWDNGAFTGTGENFGVLDRKLNVWKFQEIIQGLMQGLEDR